jgi:DNA mismatch repair protein MutS
MAIARAIVEYLAAPGRACRTIFSTHYHELAVVQNQLELVRNFHMDVREGNEGVVFTYRVIPGSADRSYGVHVARLAGLPGEVVQRAAAVLAELEANGGDVSHPQPSGANSPDGARKVPALIHELAAVDVERTTPLEALGTLERLRAEARAWLQSGDE